MAKEPNPENNNSNEQDFVYKDEKDFITRQSRRAKVLIRWWIGLLLFSALLYLVFHFVIFATPGEIFPLEWRAVTAESGISERAFDWGLWSLVGTLVFLMLEVQKYYRDIPKLARKGSPQTDYEPTFIEYTNWYKVALIRGPIIAVVILLFFNAANLDLATGNGGDAAIKFNFSELDHRATLLLAFILGYHHRVARNVLDGIVKSLFSKAWAEANEDFEIKPSDVNVILGGAKVFKTDPFTDVIWSASLGTIDDTGKYTAPTGAEHCGKQIVGTAVTKGAKTIAHSATVNLVPFEIVGEKEIELSDKNTEYAYGLSPVVSNVKWELSPADGGGDIDRKGVFKAPTQNEAKAETVKIIAKTTLKDSSGKDKDCSASLDVKLKK